MPHLSEYYDTAVAQPTLFLRKVRAAIIGARAAKITSPSFDEDDAKATLRRLRELDSTLSRTVKLLGKEPQQVRRWVARATQFAFEEFFNWSPLRQ